MGRATDSLRAGCLQDIVVKEAEAEEGGPHGCGQERQRGVLLDPS